MEKYIRFWLPVIIFYGLIFYLSSVQNPFNHFFPRYFPQLEGYEVPSAGSGNTGFSTPMQRYGALAHFVFFGILGFLILRGALGTEKKWVIWKAIIVAIILAVLDEVHQAFVPTRTFQLSDIVVDIIGSVIGICILLLIKKYILIE